MRDNRLQPRGCRSDNAGGRIALCSGRVTRLPLVTGPFVVNGHLTRYTVCGPTQFLLRKVPHRSIDRLAAASTRRTPWNMRWSRTPRGRGG